MTTSGKKLEKSDSAEFKLRPTAAAAHPPAGGSDEQRPNTHLRRESVCLRLRVCVLRNCGRMSSADYHQMSTATTAAPAAATAASAAARDPFTMLKDSIADSMKTLMADGTRARRDSSTATFIFPCSLFLYKLLGVRDASKLTRACAHLLVLFPPRVELDSALEVSTCFYLFFDFCESCR